MATVALPPGFRFHPTDEELVVYYLKRKVAGKKQKEEIIRELDIYKYEPVELPGLSILPSRDPEWYYFNLQDRNGSRISRTTKAGYWKATGRDRTITVDSCQAGVKKTLIYYEGRAPTGKRTDWVMHEYRLGEDLEKKINTKHHYVLCRVRMKGGPGPRNGERYGAPVLEDSDIFASELQGETSGEVPEVISGDGPPQSSASDWNEVFDMLLTEDQSQLQPSGSGIINQMESEVAQYSDPIRSATAEVSSTNFENLHQILHPDPEESDILGEMLQQITDEGGQFTNTENNLVSDVLDDNLILPEDFDFLELDDLEGPLSGPIPDLPGLGASVGPNFELETSQEPQMATGWFHEGLVDQGTATRRLRLQLPATSEAQFFSNDHNLFGESHGSNEQLIPQVSALESGLGDMNSIELENISNHQHIILDDQNILSSISSTGSGLSLVQYTPNAANSSNSPDPGDLLTSIKKLPKQQEVKLDSKSNDMSVNPIVHISNNMSSSSSSTKIPLSTSVMTFVLGFLEGMPVLPASAFESTSELGELGSQLMKTLDGKSSTVELRHLHPRSFISAGTNLHQRNKKCEVEPVTEIHQISKSSSRKSVKGCGIGFSVFLFRIATFVLILFCLFRGFCKFPRSMFSSHL